MLMHAPWGGRAMMQDALVLDVFAGTGALGLEALSRGAARAVFIERDARALAALRANVAACGAGDRARIVAADVLHAPQGPRQTLVFLDPPYDCGLLQPAIDTIRRAGWVGPGTLLITENSRLETTTVCGVTLAQRMHGAGQLNVWREP